MVRRLLSVVLAAVLLAGAAVVLPGSSDAADPGALRAKRDAARSQERSLAASLARLAGQEAQLNRQIAALERRRAAVQADLARDEVKLTLTQDALRKERARALRLRTRLTQARDVLRRRLIERYEAPHVDLISVVMNSANFSDLMERASFLKRIQHNDQQIVVAVKTARADAIGERRRLDAAEARQAQVVAGLRARRNAIAGMEAGVSARRAAVQRIRAARSAALQAAHRNRHRLEKQLAAAEAAEAAVARAAAAGAPANIPTGGWAIPWEIVQCESGGQNLPPNSAGASGYYQIMPATWKGLGGRGPAAYLRPKAEQDAAAAKLWNGGAGAHNWVCYDLLH